MFTKSFPAALVAADGLEEGQFEALVSVFGNVDSYGDVVMPGAFAATLADWSEKGDPIPIYYSHQLRDPHMCIGEVLAAAERDDGLWVRGQLDLDAPNAAQVHRLMQKRRVTQFSFSYDIVDGGFAERDGKDVYELRQLRLYEVGPTPIGANQETELLAVKHRVVVNDEEPDGEEPVEVKSEEPDAKQTIADEIRTLILKGYQR